MYSFTLLFNKILYDNYVIVCRKFTHGNIFKFNFFSFYIIYFFDLLTKAHTEIHKISCNSLA